MMLRHTSVEWSEVTHKINHIFPEDSLSLVCAQVVEILTKHNSHNYRLVGLRVNHSVGNGRSDCYLQMNQLDFENHRFKLKTLDKSPSIVLGPVYTMDHEVGPRLCKAVNWLLKLSRDNFGLHQGKHGRGTMKVEVPKI